MGEKLLYLAPVMLLAFFGLEVKSAKYYDYNQWSIDGGYIGGDNERSGRNFYNDHSNSIYLVKSGFSPCNYHENERIGRNLNNEYPIFDYSVKSRFSPCNYNIGRGGRKLYNYRPISGNPVKCRSSRCGGGRGLIPPSCGPHTCGAGAHCVQGDLRPVCACLPGYSGDPLSQCNKIECVDNSDCRSHQACMDHHCVNACEGACGIKAVCEVHDHIASCRCLPGYTGDAFSFCSIIDPEEPCHPSPCGKNTKCFVSNNRATCACLDGYIGDPMIACKHECESNGECGDKQMCRNFICVNPCSDFCGDNAKCELVAPHRAICKCPPGYKGDPYSKCILDPCAGACGENADCSLHQLRPVCSCPRNMIGDPLISCKPDPCHPSPCGKNTECYVSNNVAICKCLPGYSGNAMIGCSHECESDGECGVKQICRNFKCVNPCSDLCGDKAKCEFVAPHRAICKCSPGFKGDPYTKCIPECTIDAECPSNKPACKNNACTDPCAGACGENADCSLRQLKPVCSCPKNMIGDPYISCKPDPCHPSPCGKNTECYVSNNVGICKCLPGYSGNAMIGCSHECESDGECGVKQICRNFKCVNPCSDLCGDKAKCEFVAPHRAICKCSPGFKGDPYTKCIPECTIDAECPSNKPACKNNFCTDPCAGACGENADCSLRQLKPVCFCPTNMIGNPYISCKPDPCHPSPCGNNTECYVSNNVGICKCLPGYSGNAIIGCSHECESDGECGVKQMCRNFKCVNPCSDLCGDKAKCEFVASHRAICKCPPGFKGDPYTMCIPECTIDAECPSNKPACKNNACTDPCAGACGENADCSLHQLRPVCSCPMNMIGNPLISCKNQTRNEKKLEPLCEMDGECGVQEICRNFKCVNPCSGLCGDKAKCELVAPHRAICKCPTGFKGDPYTMCITECTIDAECPSNKPACKNNACTDPCAGACGENADCSLHQLRPVCTCPINTTGDPSICCKPFDSRDLCKPNPCGTNAVCTPGFDDTGAERPVCTCPPGYFGDALVKCEKGECEQDYQCQDHLACVDCQCVDPCLGNTQCGLGANCVARNHIAACTCPVGHGDALVNCFEPLSVATSRRYNRSKRNGNFTAVVTQTTEVATKVATELTTETATELATEVSKQEKEAPVTASNEKPKTGKKE